MNLAEPQRGGRAIRARAYRPSTRRVRIAVALLAPFVGGCAGGEGVDTAPTPTGRTAAEIEALYEARTESARNRFVEADVHFVTAMIAHHAQALVMAELAATHGASPEIETLAARVTNGQRDEIASMRAWLADRGQPVPEVEIEGLEVRMPGAEHVLPMPGMLSPEEMRELDRVRGPEFDRLFLERMIMHHEGAVEMVEELFATDGAGQDDAVFRLASDIQVDQRTEIARMQRMLAELRAPGE